MTENDEAAKKDHRVLVFGLFGADAGVTQQILASANVSTVLCDDIDALANAISEGAAAVIVAEEALVPGVAKRLVAVLDAQPRWSDVPVIVSVTERDYATGLLAALSARVNVIPLERPIGMQVLISTVRSALRARKRQYEARDFAEKRERYGERSALLARTSELLSASLEVDKCLHGLASALLESVASTISIDLVDDAGELRISMIMDDRDPTLARRCRELRAKYAIAPAHPLMRALRAEHAQILSGSARTADDAGAGAGERRALYEELGIRSIITAPLLVRGAAIGVMAVGARDRDYDEDDRDLIEEIAGRAAIAVDNARLYAEAENARARTDRLQGLAAAFSAARTPRDVAEVALTQGCAAANAPRGFLGVLAERDTMVEMVLMRGYPAELVDEWRRISMTTSTPLTKAVRSGAPAFYPSRVALTESFPHLATTFTDFDQAAAVLPLAVGGRTFGAMAFTFEHARSFAETDRTHLLTLARLCAQAMDRAALFDLAQRERQRAEEANRTKDEFLATVSHELRTPLTAMLGWTRMLRTGTFDAARREKALETIERNALAQTQLIEDLLDVTRIITGKLRLSVGPVDLARVINASVETVKPAADAKGVVIETIIDREHANVHGDGERLQQIVWNLLSNAVKFTGKGGRVGIRLSRGPGGAQITVEDTGIGIASEFLPHIFERFRQADSSTTRSFGGLGLGLAIVKNLVELHGGTIEVVSEGVGRGATFIVRIPVEAAQASFTPPVGAVDIELPLEAQPMIAGLRVLVVEDEPDARDLLVALLEQRRIVVRTASSAAEGLAEVNTWKPDVILSDIGMPGEDGYAFIQKVRALPHDQGGLTPAIALTAFARSEDRRKAMLAGFDMHLPKPIDPARLIDVLASVGA